MKVAILRHAREYHVFRSLAIAQAVLDADPTAEVFVDCLQQFNALLTLDSRLKWKHPHVPYAVSERNRPTDKPLEKGQVTRAGGPLFDKVLNFDGETRFEARWMDTGLSFFGWIHSIANDQFPGLEAPRFPTIRLRLAPAAGRPPGVPAQYVLAAPLSEEADPRAFNLNAIRALIEERFPGIPVLWISWGMKLQTDSDRVARFRSYAELCHLIVNAEAVVAVNSLTAALAQSRLVDEAGPMAKKFLYLVEKPRKGDFYAQHRARLVQGEAELIGQNPGHEAITFDTKT